MGPLSVGAKGKEIPLELCKMLKMKVAVSILCLIWISRLALVQCGEFDSGVPFNTSQCSLSPSLLFELRSYKSVADIIYSATTQGSFRGKTYAELAFFVDSFGPRLSGSLALKRALEYLERKLQRLGLQNVHSESIPVPKMTRFVNSAKMITRNPTLNITREQEMGIVASGFSVSTPPTGITKEVLLVSTSKYLTPNKWKVINKIVVFTSLEAKLNDYLAVQDAGAAGIILRSPVSFSIYSLTARTGDEKIRIPIASLTNEDVDLMVRLTQQGNTIALFMNIQQVVTPEISSNVIGDLRGRSKPDEIVIVSGHADSWDLSQGASDDGVGVILSYQVPKLFQQLRLTPKRTIRTVFWTGEEEGPFGSIEYAKRHKEESDRVSTVLEADAGCFAPTGFDFGGNDDYGCILSEIAKLLDDKLGGPRKLFKTGTKSVSGGFSEIGTDVGSFFPYGIPGANLNGDTKRYKYSWYAHTRADTMSVISSKQLDKCLALYATTAYVMADLKNLMPRI